MTSTPFAPQVGIREIRKAYGLSVDDLCDRIELHLGQRPHGDTIRNVELGRKPASDKLMTAWAKALGLVPLDIWRPKAAAVLSPKRAAS